VTLITLLTDYGTSDPYVGEMKGVLLSLAPGSILVDITHSIAPGDLPAASYILGRTWSRFPSGTVHLVVVDPGVGTARGALAFTAKGHGFVGPDNGVFSAVLHGTEVETVSLPLPEAASATFHGRDVFAPAAAALARGEPVSSLGQPYSKVPVRLSGRAPAIPGQECDRGSHLHRSATAI
jgi:S-adenosylmethionine hydrolase